MDEIGHSGIDDIVLKKASTPPGILGIIFGKGGRVRGRIPIQSVVIDLDSVERPTFSGVDVNLSLLRQVNFSAIVGADVKSENIIVACSSAGREKSDAIAGRIVSVVVLDGVVVVVIVNVKISAVTSPALIRVRLVVLNGAGVTVPLP